MKSWFTKLLIGLAATAVAAVFFLVQQPPDPSPIPVAPHATAATASAITEAPIATPADTSRTVAAHDVIGSCWNAGMPAEFAAFRDWSKRYLAASPSARPALLAEGIALAKARRTAMAKCIVEDPELALALAVPMVVRQELPQEIVALLEDRISGEGSLSLMAVTAAEGATVAEPVFHTALIGGNQYRAYVYGRRAPQLTLTKTSITGVAVDKALAVSESPLRVMESGELAAGRPVDNVCMVSGQATPVVGGKGFNSSTATAVEVNGTIHVLCHAEHVQNLEAQLIAAEYGPATSGEVGTSGIVGGRAGYAWTHGTKRVLVMVVDFSDQPGAPITTTGVVNLFNNANGIHDYYNTCSYGQTNLQVDPAVSGVSTSVTPLLRMPQTAAYYSNNDYYDQLLADAKVAALAAGYDASTFDRPGIFFNSTGGSFAGWAGLAYVGNTGFWIRGSFNLKVVSHEIGHNYGLWHANLWKVTDGNPVSATGTNLEYGDPFDNMGGNGEFSHWNRNMLQWLPDSAINTVTTSGTYRIYRFDAGLSTNTGSALTLKVNRDATRDYWIGYRRNSGNASLNGGAYILWGYQYNTGAHLLDMTTPGVSTTDAGLAIGATFNDPVGGVTLQPLAQGGTGAGEYLDVSVTLAPRVGWSQTSYAADSQGGSAVVTLIRQSSSVGAVTATYTTVPGTATAPANYTTTTGSVNWADGDATPKAISIPLTTGTPTGGIHTFTVNLTGVTGGVVDPTLSTTSTTVNISDPGVRDSSYGTGYMDNSTYRILPLPDGTSVIGGAFTQIYDLGFTNAYSRHGISQLDANGVVDPSFASGGGIDTGNVYDLARQPDGRIIVAGSFGKYNGTARAGVARVLADGSLDTSFNPGTGVNAGATVYAALVQPDGKILIGGTFTSFNGVAREYLARLNSDGSLDTGFTGPNFIGTTSYWVRALALQADGKILAGGDFYLNAASPFKAGLCRLLPTGALDATFSGLGDGAHLSTTFYAVNKVVVQPDGQLLIAGNFPSFNGTSRGGLARLISTGALDTSFAPTISASGVCNALLLEPDGKFIVGGAFTAIGGGTATNLARFSSAGAFDAPFAVAGGPTGVIIDLAQQADGKGLFGNLSGGIFQGGGSISAWRFMTGMGASPGTVQFASTTYSGSQGTSVVLSVTRTGGSLGALTVGYSTVPGSAHFAATSGVLNWANGDTAAKTISVPLTYGFLSGATESCTVNLGSPLIGGAQLGTSQQSVITINPAAAPPAVAGDLNGDGMSDILWENTSTGDRGYWTMNGTTFSSWIDVGIISPDLRIAGTGDFNGDGKTDILWENTVTGKRVIWFMNGTTFVSSLSLGNVSTDWRIAAVADFNNDGKPDILWENTLTGDRGFWLMNGATFSSWVDIGVVSTDWRIAGAGDFNADGKPDLVWENTVTGDRGFWLMNGTSLSSWVDIGVVSTDWRIAGIGDFNADGHPDLLWENTTTGDRGFWLMSGTTFSSWVDIGVVSTDWRIAN